VPRFEDTVSRHPPYYRDAPWQRIRFRAAITSAQTYRPRHPERSVLYRALAHHFERFLLVYEDRFQDGRGYLRRCVEPAIHRYLDCGIFDQGAARVRCPDCRHEFLVAFSCKLRGLCPSCHQKRELLWAGWAEQELLEDRQGAVRLGHSNGFN
jgi:hypothetical protein